MKKFFYLIAAIALFNGVNAQAVGIGTNVPNTNAVVDIFSTNKGMLIPRILDTANVNNPIEGLIIYNRNTRSPYYYDGSKWLSLGGRPPSTQSTNTDRMTYQVSGPGFSNNEQPLLSLSNGVSLTTNIGAGGLTAGSRNFSDFNFMKEMDINSKTFNLGAIIGTKYASIEIKLYASGASVPYVSYRYKNVIISSYQISASAGGGPVTESMSVAFENYGFKDWVNNVEFGFNLINGALSTY